MHRPSSVLVLWTVQRRLVDVVDPESPHTRQPLLTSTAACVLHFHFLLHHRHRQLAVPGLRVAPGPVHTTVPRSRLLRTTLTCVRCDVELVIVVFPREAGRVLRPVESSPLKPAFTISESCYSIQRNPEEAKTHEAYSLSIALSPVSSSATDQTSPPSISPCI